MAKGKRILQPMLESRSEIDVVYRDEELIRSPNKERKLRKIDEERHLMCIPGVELIVQAARESNAYEVADEERRNNVLNV